MATLLTIRPPDGDQYQIAIDGDRFVDSSSDVDGEIDTSSMWALPGLADAHAHLTMTALDDINGISDEAMRRNIPINAWAHLENGVLLVLDKGGTSDITLMSLEHDQDVMPYIEAAGALIHPAAGYAEGFGVEVDPEDLVDFVATKAETRGGWVKIVGDWPRRGLGPVSNYPVDVLTEAVEVVHQAGARVAIHSMAHSASDAVAAGVDSIEHGPLLSEADLTVLGLRNGVWVPTIVNMVHLIDLLGPESSGGRLFTKGLEAMRTNLPLAMKLGVTVLAGTDLAVPHGNVAAEALRLFEYGLTDQEATDATSLNAYKYVGRPDSIRPGNPADVVFFHGSPYADVTTLGHPALIIRRGKIVPINDLD